MARDWDEFIEELTPEEEERLKSNLLRDREEVSPMERIRRGIEQLDDPMEARKRRRNQS